MAQSEDFLREARLWAEQHPRTPAPTVTHTLTHTRTSEPTATLGSSSAWPATSKTQEGTAATDGSYPFAFATGRAPGEDNGIIEKPGADDRLPPHSHTLSHTQAHALGGGLAPTSTASGPSNAATANTSQTSVTGTSDAGMAGMAPAAPGGAASIPRLPLLPHTLPPGSHTSGQAYAGAHSRPYGQTQTGSHMAGQPQGGGDFPTGRSGAGDSAGGQSGRRDTDATSAATAAAIAANALATAAAASVRRASLSGSVAGSGGVPLGPAPLSMQLANAATAPTAVEASMTLLTAQLTEERARADAAEARCAALEQALERYSQQGTSLESQLEMLGGAVREELAKMSDEADAAQARIVQLERALAESRSMVDRLTAEVSAARDASDHQASEAATARSEAMQVIKQFHALAAERDQLAAAVKAQAAQARSGPGTNEFIAALRQQVDALQLQNGQLTGEMQAAQAEMQRLRAALAASVRANAAVAAQIPQVLQPPSTTAGTQTAPPSTEQRTSGGTAAEHGPADGRAQHRNQRPDGPGIDDASRALITSLLGEIKTLRQQNSELVASSGAAQDRETATALKAGVKQSPVQRVRSPERPAKPRSESAGRRGSAWPEPPASSPQSTSTSRLQGAASPASPRQRPPVSTEHRADAQHQRPAASSLKTVCRVRQGHEYSSMPSVSVEALANAGLIRVLDRGVQRMFTCDRVVPGDAGETAAFADIVQAVQRTMAVLLTTPPQRAGSDQSPAAVILVAAAPSMQATTMRATIIHAAHAIFDSITQYRIRDRLEHGMDDFSVTVTLLDVHGESIRDALLVKRAESGTAYAAPVLSPPARSGAAMDGGIPLAATRVQITSASEAELVARTGLRSRDMLYEGASHSPLGLRGPHRGHAIYSIHVSHHRAAGGVVGTTMHVVQLAVPGWVASGLAAAAHSGSPEALNCLTHVDPAAYDATHAAALQLDSAHISRTLEALADAVQAVRAAQIDGSRADGIIQQSMRASALVHTLGPDLCKSTSNVCILVDIPQALDYACDADSVSFLMMAHDIAGGGGTPEQSPAAIMDAEKRAHPSAAQATFPRSPPASSSHSRRERGMETSASRARGRSQTRGAPASVASVSSDAPLFAPPREGGRRRGSLSRAYYLGKGVTPEELRAAELQAEQELEQSRLPHLSLDESLASGLASGAFVRRSRRASLASALGSTASTLHSVPQIASRELSSPTGSMTVTRAGTVLVKPAIKPLTRSVIDVDAEAGIGEYADPKLRRVWRERERLQRAQGQRVSTTRSGFIPLEDYLALDGPAAAVSHLVSDEIFQAPTQRARARALSYDRKREAQPGRRKSLASLSSVPQAPEWLSKTAIQVGMAPTRTRTSARPQLRVADDDRLAVVDLLDGDGAPSAAADATFATSLRSASRARSSSRRTDEATRAEALRVARSILMDSRPWRQGVQTNKPTTPLAVRASLPSPAFEQRNAMPPSAAANHHTNSAPAGHSPPASAAPRSAAADVADLAQLDAEIQAEASAVEALSSEASPRPDATTHPQVNPGPAEPASSAEFWQLGRGIVPAVSPHAGMPPADESLRGDPVPGMRRLLQELSSALGEQLSPHSFSVLHQLFADVDTRRVDRISDTEFAEALARFSPSLPVDELMRDMHLQGMATIDYRDFLVALQALAQSENLMLMA